MDGVGLNNLVSDSVAACEMFEGFGTTFVYVVVRRVVFDLGVSFYCF